MALNLFGWEIPLSRRSADNQDNLKSVTKDENDGSVVITTDDSGVYSDVSSAGGYQGYSYTFDVDPTVISETQLITRYRELSLVPEVEKAVEAIINEMISTSENKLVEIDLDELTYSDSVKKKITDEFEYIVKLMDFNNAGYEILKRWYVDGRFQYQVVIDKEQYKQQGIGKLTYLDPRKIKKVKLVKKEKDQRTGADTYSKKTTYYAFNEAGFASDPSSVSNQSTTGTIQDGVIYLPEDSIVQVTSGLLNSTNSTILSYLHKAIRPLNQLKSLEDAVVIYRLARAPERRVFYIDVGNLPPHKAAQALRVQMNQYKSKLVYDASTGSVRSDSKAMTMIEDFWLPRRSDGKATQIDTLPAGQNLGEMSDVNYFLNKLYNSLNVPVTRMDPSAGFSLGRSTEITRDEVTLHKFVERIRRRFATIFLDLLKRQLTLKNVMTPDEFERIRQDISFEFASDNHFEEMLANEVMEGRLNLLDRMKDHIGTFFSKEYVFRNVLYMSEEDIKEMQEQIDKEDKSGEYDKMMAMAGNEDFSTVLHQGDDKPPEKKSEPAAKKTAETTKPINNNNNGTDKTKE